MTLVNTREEQIEALGKVITGEAALIGRRADLASDSRAVQAVALAEEVYGILRETYDRVWEVLHDSDLNEED